MKSYRLFCVIWLFSSLVCGLVGGQEQDVARERLQQLLKRSPNADANKDGVLTRAEAQAYRNKAAAQRKANQQRRKSIPAPTFADVEYGPHARNVLDFHQAKSDGPSPLIVYIHGGGFVGGSKSSINPVILQKALDSGISCAAIHYRFVDGRETIFPAPQHDGARAVQFLRSKAKEWNINPRKVACYGGSAGAGISMWIGFHDELADAESDDLVLRQSTRIQAIGTFGGQGTYDPIKIKKLVGGRAWEHPSLLKVYGLTTNAEALQPTEDVQQLYDECAAITHLTRDDPPLFMVYSEADGPLPADTRPGQGIHHPNFGRQLKERMDNLKIENVFVYTPDNRRRDVATEMLQFFQQQFASVK